MAWKKIIKDYKKVQIKECRDIRIYIFDNQSLDDGVAEMSSQRRCSTTWTITEGLQQVPAMNYQQPVQQQYPLPPSKPAGGTFTFNPATTMPVGINNTANSRGGHNTAAAWTHHQQQQSQQQEPPPEAAEQQCTEGGGRASFHTRPRGVPVLPAAAADCISQHHSNNNHDHGHIHYSSSSYTPSSPASFSIPQQQPPPLYCNVPPTHPNPSQQQNPLYPPADHSCLLEPQRGRERPVVVMVAAQAATVGTYGASQSYPQFFHRGEVGGPLLHVNSQPNQHQQHQYQNQNGGAQYLQQQQHHYQGQGGRQQHNGKGGSEGSLAAQQYQPQQPVHHLPFPHSLSAPNLSMPPPPTAAEELSSFIPSDAVTWGTDDMLTPPTIKNYEN
jgi:hypothetical protein